MISSCGAGKLQHPHPPAFTNSRIPATAQLVGDPQAPPRKTRTKNNRAQKARWLQSFRVNFLTLWEHIPEKSISVQFRKVYKKIRGLPWWFSDLESACQCRGHGFEPWSRKIPHAAEQLSPCATTTEACAPRARAPQQEKPPQWEARAPQRRVDRLAATREKPMCSNEHPTQPKIKKK